MRGHLTQRGKGRWTVVLSHMEVNPETGRKRLRQKWVSLGKCNKRQAQTKLNDMLSAFQKNEFVEPTKVTFGGWLWTWLDEAVKPPARRVSTYASYRAII